eukprot:1100339-Pelagomonas_calceolata.AAC.2
MLKPLSMNKHGLSELIPSPDDPVAFERRCQTNGVKAFVDFWTACTSCAVTSVQAFAASVIAGECVHSRAATGAWDISGFLGLRAPLVQEKAFTGIL